MTSAAILHEHPAPPELRPDLPPRLEQAILTLLEKDRDIRTQTASELRAEPTRLNRELGASRTSGTATSAAALTSDPRVSAAAQISVAAPPPSSSDAQLIAGVVRRHRGAPPRLAVARYSLTNNIVLFRGLKRPTR